MSTQSKAKTLLTDAHIDVIKNSLEHSIDAIGLTWEEIKGKTLEDLLRDLAGNQADDVRDMPDSEIREEFDRNEGHVYVLRVVDQLLGTQHIEELQSWRETI